TPPSVPPPPCCQASIRPSKIGSIFLCFQLLIKSRNTSTSPSTVAPQPLTASSSRCSLPRRPAQKAPTPHASGTNHGALSKNRHLWPRVAHVTAVASQRAVR